MSIPNATREQLASQHRIEQRAAAVLDATGRRLRDALHVTVVEATRRMRDEGLAHRVLAAEGRLVMAAAGIEDLFSRRWRDEFGLVHCPCGRRLTSTLREVVPEMCPRCRRWAS